MLQLITGLPGNGKTLYALAYVKKWAEKENRPVFYSGIPELTLPWTEVEADKWFECPPNSIVVIDECQRVFRPRSMGSQVPEYVSRLETHRHQGLDIVLITQHPMLADSALRRLVGKHMHVIRKFGTQNATIHEWGSVKESCDKPVAKQDSIKHHWTYDKNLFDVYKSAEAHTVKRDIPIKIYLFAAIPFLLCCALVYMYYFAQQKMQSSSPKSSELTKVQQTDGEQNFNAIALTPPVSRAAYNNGLEEAKQYIYERTPRFAGLDYTAPRYDRITQPVRAPLPAACLSMNDRCQCYSQQATRLDVSAQLCREIVDKGFYLDFDDRSDPRNERQIEFRPVESNPQ